MVNSRPRNEFKERREYLEAIKVKATTAAKEADPFSFELFEKKLQRRKVVLSHL